MTIQNYSSSGREIKDMSTVTICISERPALADAIKKATTK